MSFVSEHVVFSCLRLYFRLAMMTVLSLIPEENVIGKVSEEVSASMRKEITSKKGLIVEFCAQCLQQFSSDEYIQAILELFRSYASFGFTIAYF
jgi:hypothetical protein